MPNVQTKSDDMANLKDLKPLAKKLNAKTDDLNASLRTIEEKLNEMGLGIETRLPLALVVGPKTFRPDDAEGPHAHAEYVYNSTHLGYGRHGERWALLVHEILNLGVRDESNNVEDQEQEDEHPKPLLQASRAIRIKAVEHIEPLIEHIKAQASDSIEKIEKARRIALSLASRDDEEEAWEQSQGAWKIRMKCDACGKAVRMAIPLDYFDRENEDDVAHAISENFFDRQTRQWEQWNPKLRVEIEENLTPDERQGDPCCPKCGGVLAWDQKLPTTLTVGPDVAGVEAWREKEAAVRDGAATARKARK
jgi:hypothetical protein